MRYGRLRRPPVPPVPRAPVLVVAGLAAVDLWWHRHLLWLVAWPNDLPLHLSMVQWGAERVAEGTVPWSGWFPRLSGGLPQFQHYQSLPHAVTGTLPLEPASATHLLLWVLVGTWPCTLYVGCRALGLSEVASVLSAAVAPLAASSTGYGFESFSYLWLGNGLWSQAWGMWLVPLALGWTARAVRTGTGVGRAVVAMAVTTAVHLPTAWFAYLALGIWVVVSPSQWRARVPRALVVGSSSLVASAWMLVPFLVDGWAVNRSSFNGDGSLADSFGWSQVGRWLVRGEVFDAGRLGVLSAVALGGCLVVARRWRQARPGEREIVLVGGLALVLFVGRDPFGPVLALVPGASMVFLHRYVAFVQLAMAVLAAIALDRTWRWWSARPRRQPMGASTTLAVALVVTGLLLVPAVRSVHLLLGRDRTWAAAQREADATVGADVAHLVSLAHGRGDGRVTLGNTHGAGRATTIGAVAGPVWLAHLPVDQMGYTLRVSALAADLEVLRDESDPATFDALGVRYVVLGAGGAPPDGSWLLARRGVHTLWEVPASEPVTAARVAGSPIRTDHSSIAADLAPVLGDVARAWPDGARLVDLAGRSPLPEARPSGGDGGSGRPIGTVDEAMVDLDRGAVSASVSFASAGVMVVKANWHPRWEARVDGERVPVAMAAPTWMAVPVEAGRHEVQLGFRGWPWTPHLAALAPAAVVASAWWSRRFGPVDGPEVTW